MEGKEKKGKSMCQDVEHRKNEGRRCKKTCMDVIHLLKRPSEGNKDRAPPSDGASKESQHDSCKRNYECKKAPHNLRCVLVTYWSWIT